MILSKEDARDLISDDLPEWELVEEKFIHSSRWENHYKSIVLDTNSGKYYCIKWSRGLPDSDVRAFEYSDPELIEVKPVDVVVTKRTWEKVNV